MTTAERIAAVNDRGQFEILATAVLRYADPDCVGLIHAGVNDAGETIVAPLDGFRVITHTIPPKVVFVAHTTTARDKLRGKLLTAEDSDLRKAEERFSEYRATLPGAAAKIVLCINEPMGRQEDLYIDMAKKAVELNAELDVWDRGRLASFLDNNPEGQWIRQCHFRVSAQRPSPGLLRMIGRRSIQALRDEVSRDAAVIVDRSVDRALDSLPTPTVTWLVGSSGSGKSTAALRYAERVLLAGGFAFYLPAGALHPGFGLAEVLEQHLSALHPDFAPGVGDAALRLATEFKPINLVVEDINRSEAGDRLGTRLAAWGAPPKTTDSDNQVTALPIHFIVPVWPDLWETNARAWGNRPRSRVIDVGPLTSNEAVAAIQELACRRGFDVSSVEAEDIGAAVGEDPFLVGLLSELSNEVSTTPELLRIANLNVVDEFLRRQAARLVPLSNRPAEDYTDALNAAADHMLRSRILRPTVQQVRDWLDQREWSAISELLNDGALCRRIAGKDDQERLAMRHDRFQSALLARRAGQLLRDVDNNTEVLGDPFYAAIVGHAIAVRAGDANDFPKIMELSPVAMFEAMRLVGEPSDAYENALIDACQSWAEGAGQTALDVVVWAISRILLATDSRAAYRVACTLPQNHVLLLSRFRNGDAQAAVGYVQGGWHELHPASRDDWFEKTIPHARMHHGRSVSSQILELLRNTNSSEIACRAITMAGYLQVKEIWSIIPEMMTRATLDQRGLLPSLLWVGLRCAVDSKSIVPALLDRLMALPTGKPDGSMNERGRLCQSLGWAGRHGYSHEAVTAVIEWAGAIEDRRTVAATILESVDDADSAEFVARVRAEVKYWGGPRHSPDTLSTGELERRLWSSECMTRLQQLWSDRNNGEKLRRSAFNMWLEGTAHEQIQTVVDASDDAALFGQALQWRAKVADHRVTPMLIKEARRLPFWWRLAHHVWNPVLRTALEAIIADQNDEKDVLWNIGDLLCDIPEADAEAILLQNHSVVRDSEPLICAAAVVGTPKLQHLIAEALTSWTGEGNPLRFAGSRLGELRFKGGAQPARFKRLEPFLDKVDNETLKSFGSAAEASGAGDWAETHIWSRTTRPNGPPGDAGFVAELNHLYADSRLPPEGARYSCDRFIRSGKTSRKILALTLDWVRKNLNERGIAVAAEVVAYVGGRDDMGQLDRLVRAGEASKTSDRKLRDATFRVQRATLAATAEDRDPA